MNRFTTLLTSILAAVALTGCPPPDMANGGLGVLTFDWRTPDGESASIGIPIAEGTRSTVRVRAGDGAPVVREADSTDRRVLRVIAVEGDGVQVEALAEGMAHLEVFTDRGNDWIEVEVQRAERMGLSARLSATRVLQGGVDIVRVRRFGPFGGELVGHAPIDITVEPADAATILPSPDHEMWLSYSRPGEVRLSADGAILRREVVGQDALATLAAVRVPHIVNQGQPGEVGLAALDGDGVELGALDGLLSIRAGDRDTCDATLESRFGRPVLMVEGLQRGRCAIELALGGLTERFDLEVL